jgi:hypothetical protein
MKRKLLLLASLALLSVLPLADRAFADASTDLDAARAATARFVYRAGAAEAAGYGLFRDAAGIACIAQPGVGAMGIHYVNGSLVGDTVLDPAAPEALVYEPLSFGRLRLAAVEYIVFKEAWDAERDAPPTLFGMQFELVPSPNRYGLPPFYALHAWIWKANPLGMFAPYNPRVTCP